MSYDSWKTTDPRDYEPAYACNDRDIADDADRADNDPDTGWTSTYAVAVEVTVPSRVTIGDVLNEVQSNLESLPGWSVDAIAPHVSALTPAAADILVRQMFNAFGSRAYSAIAMAICDTVDLDRETFNPLHTAYARVKAEYRRRGEL
jgi:hypothetical protein